MAALPPGALIRFVQKGVQYAELEANLKEVHRSFNGENAQINYVRINTV